MIRLIDDERHLIAHELYHNVLDRLDADHAQTTQGHPHKHRLRLRKSKSHIAREEHTKDIQATRELIQKNQSKLDDLSARCRMFAKAKENLLDDNHWTFAQTMFGVTTYYRHEEDGSLSIKIEGRLEGVSLFDQVAVLREVDLHYKWAPFVSSSLTIAHLNKLDTVGWIVVGLPSFGLMRDACFRAIGCDSMMEDGTILLVGQGIADRPEHGVKDTSLKLKRSDATTSSSTVSSSSDFEYLSNDPILKELDLPPPPTRMGSGRMIIRKFQSIIHVESPTSARTRLIANVDPNLPFIPQSLIDFLMKKLCGVLLNKLQNAAKRVSKDPIHNPHASKMRQEEDFYKHWLMMKFSAVCKLRNWVMPPVTCFELTDQQLERAREADEAKHKNKPNKTIRFYHSLSDDGLDNYLEEADNMSEPPNVGQRSPKVRTMSEDSIISDISRNSSTSIWQKNPISSYLREVEERTQLRKAREIEQARERAASRLKPRQLDEDSRNRLQELRQAQEHRVAGIKSQQKPVIPIDSSQSQRNFIKEQHKQDWVTMWTSHGIATRVLVMFTLIALLFAVTYMVPIFENYVVDHGQSFWGKRIQEAATVIYMLLAASIHFLMCYVALMYAFSALQIGSIAGRQAKRFYSQNTHVILAMASGGIVVVAMLHASLIVALRWLVWKCFILYDLSKLWIGLIQNRIIELLPQALVSSSIVSTLCSFSTYSLGLQGAASLTSALLQTLYYVMFQSNTVGRMVVLLVTQLMRPFVFLTSSLLAFIERAIDVHEGRVVVSTWREDAFLSARYLLTHSGVFLLVLLTLYYILARNSRFESALDSKDSSQEETLSSNKSNSAQVPTAPQDITRGSQDSNGIQSRAMPPRRVRHSVSPQFDTIEEVSDEGEAWQKSGSSQQELRPKRKGRVRSFGKNRVTISSAASA